MQRLASWRPEHRAEDGAEYLRSPRAPGAHPSRSASRKWSVRARAGGTSGSFISVAGRLTTAAAGSGGGGDCNSAGVPGVASDSTAGTPRLQAQRLPPPADVGPAPHRAAESRRPMGGGVDGSAGGGVTAWVGDALDAQLVEEEGESDEDDA